MLPKAWRNNKNMYALVCVDVFTKKADIEPMKDKESNTCNKAMDHLSVIRQVRNSRNYIF